MLSHPSNKYVVIADLGLGNLGSVSASFNRLGVKSILAKQPHNDLLDCSHLVLPGVGSFSEGMAALQQVGWSDWIKQIWVPSGKPLLGICLGMQLLATFGTEGSSANQPINGLNLIPGQIDLLPLSDSITLPHVGWNSIKWTNNPATLNQNIRSGTDFYFVHSYAFCVDNSAHSIATTVHGKDFSSIVRHNNVIGVQFHPEKSQMAGNLILLNFLHQD